MAEVKWQARRVSDGIMVDVTGDTEGTPAPAPTANALEGGVTAPVTFEATEDEEANTLKVTGVDAYNQLWAVGDGGSNRMRVDGENAENEMAANGTGSSNQMFAAGSGSYNEMVVQSTGDGNYLTVHSSAGYNQLRSAAGGSPLRLRRGVSANSVDILVGSADPSAGAGVAASLVGSLYVRTTGELWIKTNTGDTNWVKFATV